MTRASMACTIGRVLLGVSAIVLLVCTIQINISSTGFTPADLVGLLAIFGGVVGVILTFDDWHADLHLLGAYTAVLAVLCVAYAFGQF